MTQQIKGKYIADDAIITSKILDFAVSAQKIADDAVNGSKILLNDGEALRHSGNVELIKYDSVSEALSLLGVKSFDVVASESYYDSASDTFSSVKPTSAEHLQVWGSSPDANGIALLSGYGYVDFQDTLSNAPIRQRLQDGDLTHISNGTNNFPIIADVQAATEADISDFFLDPYETETGRRFVSGETGSNMFRVWYYWGDQLQSYPNIGSYNSTDYLLKIESNLKISNLVPASSSDLSSPVVRSQILDASGKVLTSVLPDLSITSVTVVGSEAERNALDVQSGDVAIVVIAPDVQAGTPGSNDSFIFDGSSWQPLKSTDSVVKVNGLAPDSSGNVTVEGGDVAHDSAATSGVSKAIEDNSTSISNVRFELDATQAGAGLGTNGSFIQPTDLTANTPLADYSALGLAAMQLGGSPASLREAIEHLNFSIGDIAYQMFNTQPLKESITVSSAQVSAGEIELAYLPQNGSLNLFVGRLALIEGVDYNISFPQAPSDPTKVVFSADFLAGPEAIEAGDLLTAQYSAFVAPA